MNAANKGLNGMFMEANRLLKDNAHLSFFKMDDGMHMAIAVGSKENIANSVKRVRERVSKRIPERTTHTVLLTQCEQGDVQRVITALYGICEDSICFAQRNGCLTSYKLVVETPKSEIIDNDDIYDALKELNVVFSIDRDTAIV